jgi:hypothetical protein
MRWEMLIMLLGFAVSPAYAQTPDSADADTELASVLASEEPCGLSYDQDAISRWIERHVRPDDMSFTSALPLETLGFGEEIKTMTPSTLTAHCAQIRRIAKTFGFTH